MKRNFSLICAAGAMLCLIFASSEALESARYGLSLCVELIMPSLLPFFTVSILLTRLGLPQVLGKLLGPAAHRLWGVSGAGASAFLAGICGGYPLGAQYVAELYSAGAVERDEAERLLRFCSNSGPSFIIGAVGAGVFSSSAAGVILYLVHISAAALTGMLFRKSSVSASEVLSGSYSEVQFGAALVYSVRQAVSAVLSVCGFVVCFCVFGGLIESLGLFDIAADLMCRLPMIDGPSARALLWGLLELGSGAGALRALPLCPQSLSLAAFLIGWGGLSVQFQTMAVLDGTDLSSRPHLTGRITSAFISALLAWAVGRVFLPPQLCL